MLTYLFGFTVLGILAYLVYRDQPPIPAKVVAADKVLFSREDIVGGMNVFQRYGLMEYGSVYGHGAYLGPDFTAEYLHKSAEFQSSLTPARPAGFRRASGLSPSCTKILIVRRQIRSSGAGRKRRRTK